MSRNLASLVPHCVLCYLPAENGSAALAGSGATFSADSPRRHSPSRCRCNQGTGRWLTTAEVSSIVQQSVRWQLHSRRHRNLGRVSASGTRQDGLGQRIANRRLTTSSAGSDGSVSPGTASRKRARSPTVRDSTVRGCWRAPQGTGSPSSSASREARSVLSWTVSIAAAARTSAIRIVAPIRALGTGTRFD